MMMSVPESFLREHLQRLDTIISLLQQLVDGTTAGATPYDRLMLMLLAAGLPASPALTRNVEVQTTATLIARNDAVLFARIDVTNDDPAQAAYLGESGVTTVTGRKLNGGETANYVMPQGSEVWAICELGTVSVRVSELYNALGPVMSQIPMEIF